MTDTELTHLILREIRDEIRAVNTNLSAKIDGTNHRLDETNHRLDETNHRLDETNQRLEVVEHTVNDAATQIVLLARYVKNKHEKAIDDLQERVSQLEVKANG